MAVNSKIYKKKQKCDLCKTFKQYSSIVIYNKNRNYNTYFLKNEKFQYIIKKSCLIYLMKKRKYINCANLLLKYINNSNYFTL